MKDEGRSCGFLLGLVFFVGGSLVSLVEGCALLEKLLPGAESSEGSLAVGVDVLQAIDVTCVDPSESVIVSKRDRQGKRLNLPFSSNTLEVEALVTVLGINAMRVNSSGDIVFLNNNTIIVNESLGHHEQPLVRQALRILGISVTN